MPQVSELSWSIFILNPLFFFISFFVLSIFFQNYNYLIHKTSFLKNFNFLLF